MPEKVDSVVYETFFSYYSFPRFDGLSLSLGVLLAEQGDAHRGRTLYLKHCKVGHGPEGKGDGDVEICVVG